MLRVTKAHVLSVAVFTAATAHAFTANMGFFRDLEPPAVLDGFSAASGTNAGEINVTVNFPVAPALNDYDTVVVRRLAGASAPNVLCNDGTPAKTYNVGGFGDETFVDAGLTAGSYYSYRACIYDASGNMTSSQTAVNVRAKSAPHISVCRDLWAGGSCDAYCTGLSMTCVSLGNEAAATSGNIASASNCVTVSGFASCGAMVSGWARCKCQ